MSFKIFWLKFCSREKNIGRAIALCELLPTVSAEFCTRWVLLTALGANGLLRLLYRSAAVRAELEVFMDLCLAVGARLLRRRQEAVSSAILQGVR